MFSIFSIIKSLVEVSKMKNGDVIISFNTTFFHRFFSSTTIHTFLGTSVRRVTGFLRYVFTFYYLMIMGFGVGIGLSISLVVVQSPMGAMAQQNTISLYPYTKLADSYVGVNPQFIQFVEKSNTQAQQKISIQTVDSFEHRNLMGGSQVQYISETAALHEPASMLLTVGMRSQARSYMQNVQLGSTVLVGGENNGMYKYGVSEIREVAFSDLLATVQNNTEANSLILISKAQLINELYTVVIFRPKPV